MGRSLMYISTRVFRLLPLFLTLAIGHLLTNYRTTIDSVAEKFSLS